MVTSFVKDETTTKYHNGQAYDPPKKIPNLTLTIREHQEHHRLHTGCVNRKIRYIVFFFEIWPVRGCCWPEWPSLANIGRTFWPFLYVGLRKYSPATNLIRGLIYEFTTEIPKRIGPRAATPTRKGDDRVSLAADLPEAGAGRRPDWRARNRPP